MEELTINLAHRWGADAIRDSDGTQLSEELLARGLEVYSTLCLVRDDQDYAYDNPDQLQQKYLCSEPVTARAGTVEIDPLRHYCRRQFRINTSIDPKQWWEVRDRTAGTPVAAESWEFDAERERVVIREAIRMHQYTVTFMVYQTWDSVSLYNHITNNWTCRQVMSVDPRQPKTRAHLREHLKKWLATHPHTDVVRLTTLAYNFTSIYNEDDFPAKRFLDWAGYHDTLSPLALDEFERAKGYRLKPEDIVQGGFMNETNRIPSRAYRDYMETVHDFTVELAKEWVALIHDAGKKAIMFFCDHWIGTEPYSPRFQEIGLDGLANPCMNGVEVRRIGEVPGDLFKELRLYPYFFPTGLRGEPMFMEGGDPVASCRSYWMQVRRTIAHVPVDRIGFGGYLSLASKSPRFLEYVGELADEFREMADESGKRRSQRAPFKVGILNAWGTLRSWIAGEFKQGGLLESLAGLPFDVEFISFDQVKQTGIPQGVDVLICTGDADTAWSGGELWTDPEAACAVREWIDAGGGLIGVGEPSAHEHEGRYFQLGDVLGVEGESGRTKCRRKPPVKALEEHFILEDLEAVPDLGIVADGTYILTAHKSEVDVLLAKGQDVLLSTHPYGKGRAVYFAGFKHGADTTRLLHRALFWAAGREDELRRWFSENPRTECAAYPDRGRMLVLNNSGESQRTTVHKGNGETFDVALDPYASRWFSI